MKYTFSIIDLFPYILLFILFILVGKNNMKSTIKAKRAFIVILLFDCLRYGVGYDYLGYVNAVYNQTQFYDMDQYTEPLSQVLLYIAHCTHYQVFFILSSFLTLFPIYLFCKKHSLDPYLSLFVYLCFPFFFLSGTSVIRNAIAYSMVIMALYYLLKNRIIFAILFNIIAIGFHNSAFVGLLIYPIYYLNFGRKDAIIIYIISITISSLIVTKFSFLFSGLSFYWKLEHYSEDVESGGQTITFVINFICIVMLFFWDKIKKYDNSSPLYLRLAIVGVCIWNIFMPLNSHMADRFSTFFFIYFIILFPSLVYSFRNQVIRKLSVTFFILIFLSTFVISINAFVNGNSDKMSSIPYQLFFIHTNYSNIYLNNPYE